MRSLRLAAALAAAAVLVPAAAATAAKTKPGAYTMTYKGTTKQGEKINIVVKFRLYKNPDNPPGQLDIRNDVTATVSTAATVHCDADAFNAAVDKRYEFRGSSTVRYVTDFTQADLSGFMGGKAAPGVTAGATIGGTVKKLKDRLPTKKSVLKGSISPSADPTEAGGRTCIGGDPQKGIPFTAKWASTKRR